MNKITKAQLDNIRTIGYANKIDAIKELRTAAWCGLAEAKRVVEFICGCSQNATDRAEGKRLSTELVLDDTTTVAVNANTSAPMVIDRELLAINECIATLDRLDSTSRNRVHVVRAIQYLRLRYGA
jgi:hypothetical protein